MTAESTGPGGFMPPVPAMPLMMAGEGQEVRLVEVLGGHGLARRLAEMGLTPGTSMRVVAQGRPGPFIVQVGESKLVLGRGMVHRVLVTPL
ncbi:MAG: ferrous iron transport protein A [Planctomycetes bacterium]|nr:ferrous iron transport protein A [Planctomycetota bacterium]